MESNAGVRVLIVAGKYSSITGEGPWLLDDLARELHTQGAVVDVIVHDLKQARAHDRNPTNDDGIRVWRASPRRPRSGLWGKLLGFGGTAIRLHTSAYRFASQYRYDMCIFTSVGVASAGLPRRLRNAGVARSLIFVLWDFFPVHHLEIGHARLPLLHRLLKALERATFSSADAVAVMSPRNGEFLKAYQGWRGRVLIVPPWSGDKASSTLPEPLRQSAPLSGFTVVFGGQLVAGRGVDTLIKAARILKDDNSPAQVVILGRGPLRGELEAQAAALELSNVRINDPLPRDQYRDLLRRAHIGVAVTVPGVSVPTFPSKIVEYCRSGLPVVACLEASSDAADLLVRTGAGISVPAGDAQALAAAIDQLHQEEISGELGGRRKKAEELFRAEFSIQRAASRILASARNSD